MECGEADGAAKQFRVIVIQERMNKLTPFSSSMHGTDLSAAQELLPIVYEELRKLAALKLVNEAPGHTLQPTALVHEAWLRLAASNQKWRNRDHFFSAATETMRRILVDHARRKKSQKRGNGVEPEELNESTFALAVQPEEIIRVSDALERLDREDPAAAKLVKLRYFVGMTMEEAAVALGLAPRTAERLWQYARAWLKVAVGG